MDSTSKDSGKQLAESLRADMETFMDSVMQAVNEAPDGEWIEGSEEQVRDLAAEFRKQVFEKAVQQRIDAAEADFSPSAGNDRRTAHKEESDQAAGE